MTFIFHRDDGIVNMKLQGTVLVQGGNQNASRTRDSPSRILKSSVSLSFWGGIDPETAIVIDANHPLSGECVKDCILAIPSGRGSCTASQVLLELILRKIAPKAIVMRDPDGLACVGAIVANEIFGVAVPEVIVLGEEQFQKLLDSKEGFGVLHSDGAVVLGSQPDGFLPTRSDSYAMYQETPVETFNEEELRLLEQSQSEAETMALRVIFRYARLSTSTPSYISVTNAHIDGCTYIGPGGLEFVQRLVDAGGQVSIPTTLNSVSSDRRRWKELGVPQDYAQNSIALGDAYLRLGCQPTFTCAPYLLSSAPTKGSQIVWGESNAVVFANSVIGARTEKYADYLDICCAIAGIVPAAGVHLDANRRPTVLIDGSDLFDEIFDQANSSGEFDILFPLLGHLCGSLSDGKVPILKGLESRAQTISIDNLKAFCAAFGTTGTSPVIHIAGVTAEAKETTAMEEMFSFCGTNVQTLRRTLLQQTFDDLNKQRSASHSRIDLVALGNPHLSLSECKELTRLIKAFNTNHDALKKHPDVRLVACMSRHIHSKAFQEGYIEELEQFGMEFITDTCWCMLLDPPVIPRRLDGQILTNSGKYAHYGPGLTSRQFRFGSMRDCIHASFTGSYPTATAGSGARIFQVTNSDRQTHNFVTKAVRLISQLSKR